jgi:hypothetical protein
LGGLEKADTALIHVQIVVKLATYNTKLTSARQTSSGYSGMPNHGRKKLFPDTASWNPFFHWDADRLSQFAVTVLISFQIIIRSSKLFITKKIVLLIRIILATFYDLKIIQN